MALIFGTQVALVGMMVSADAYSTLESERKTMAGRMGGVFLTTDRTRGRMWAVACIVRIKSMAIPTGARFAVNVPGKRYLVFLNVD